MRVFRRRSAGATDGTAQDSPGAQSPVGPADAKQPRSPAEAAKGRPTPKRSEAERNRRQPITGARPRPRRAPRRIRPRPAASVPARTRPCSAASPGRSTRATAVPARALARDYIDSKRRISEYYMYILVVLLVAVFLRQDRADLHLAAGPGAGADHLGRRPADQGRPAPAGHRAAAGRTHAGPDPVRRDALPADPQARMPVPRGSGRETSSSPPGCRLIGPYSVVRPRAA